MATASTVALAGVRPVIVNVLPGGDLDPAESGGGLCLVQSDSSGSSGRASWLKALAFFVSDPYGLSPRRMVDDSGLVFELRSLFH
jgi:hypothetical protein